MILTVENFRSIREQAVRIAPMTVVYGPNGAGKSSLIYALLTLKNIVLNPNQPVDAFFNYGWLNLGGFKEVVFEHNEQSEIRVGLALFEPPRNYAVKLQPGRVQFYLTLLEGTDNRLTLETTLPYPANQTLSHEFAGDVVVRFRWNGILAEADLPAGQPLLDNVKRRSEELTQKLNALPQLVQALHAVPLWRGFRKPYYSSALIAREGEDEVAARLANESELREEVSEHLETIVDRRLSVSLRAGGFISLHSRDINARLGSELVNDGFGTNQLVYLLTVALRRDASVVCIEEPEVHLHPTAIRRLARALSTIAKEKNRSFVISTHSEQFVLALLAMVKEGKLGHDEVACYLATKPDRETVFEAQPVEPTGQIKGGLSSFLEGEMEDLRTFLGVAENGGEASDVKPPDRAE